MPCQAQRSRPGPAGPSEQTSTDHEAARTTGRQHKVVPRFSGHTLTARAAEASAGHQSSQSSCAAGQSRSNPALTRRQPLNAATAAKMRQRQRSAGVRVPAAAITAVPSDEGHHRGISSKPGAASRCACMSTSKDT